MAGYTNSAGNTSASNQLGQFRYFTSSMDKLGTYKATGINIPIPKANIPQQVNWAATTANTLVKSMGVYEAYRDQQFKRAEEYLNTHSIEDYKKAMSEGEVPFQYDYLAMINLKKGYGKIVSSLAAQDFKNLVDRNYFQGKTPEEVDAAFYTHLQDSIKDFDDGTLGFSTDDYFFNQGVYEDANKTRIGMMTEHAVVEDNFLQEQFEQQKLAQARDLTSDPNKTTEDVVTGFKDLISTGYRASPAFISRCLETVINGTADNPNGVQLLDTLGKLEVSKGVTLREYMGESKYQEALINARSFRFKHDAEYRMKFQQSVDALVNEGKVNEIQALLNQHIKTNGNIQDSEYEYLLKAVDQAKTVQQRSLNSAMANDNRERAAAEWREYYVKVARSETVPTQEVFKQYIDNKYGSSSYSSNDLKVWQQEAVSAIFESGDSKAIGTLFDVVNTESSNNREMSRYVGAGLHNSMGAVNDTIEKLSSGTQVTDEERQAAISKFNAVHALYRQNPSAVVHSLNGSYTDTLSQVRLMDMAVRSGKDPLQFMADVRIAEKAMRDEKYEKSGGASTYARYQITLTELEKQLSVSPSNINALMATNEYLTAETKVRTVEYKLAKPSMSIADCLNAASSQVFDEYSAIPETAVVLPKTKLASYVSKDSPIDISRVPPNTFAEASSKQFVQMITKEGTGITKPSDYVGSYYGMNEDNEEVIFVIDANGHLRGEVPLADLANETAKTLAQESINIGKSTMEANKVVYSTVRSQEEVQRNRELYTQPTTVGGSFLAR